MATTVFDRIKNQGIAFVDLMYADLLGGWHHVTLPASRFDKALCERGVGVDGSSVTGFRKVKAGDMVLVPDLNAHFVHPFADRPTLCVLGNLVDVGMALYPLAPGELDREADDVTPGTAHGAVSGFAWSADSTRLGFVDAQGGQARVVTIRMPMAGARRLATRTSVVPELGALCGPAGGPAGCAALAPDHVRLDLDGPDVQLTVARPGTAPRVITLPAARFTAADA